VWGLALSAFFPPVSSASFQRFTEDGAAPIERATSRIPWPLANILAASRRLASNFSALPFGLIQTFIGERGNPLEQNFSVSQMNFYDGIYERNRHKNVGRERKKVWRGIAE
jgi:hypothetical protein